MGAECQALSSFPLNLSHLLTRPHPVTHSLTHLLIRSLTFTLLHSPPPSCFCSTASSTARRMPSGAPLRGGRWLRPTASTMHSPALALTSQPLQNFSLAGTGERGREGVGFCTTGTRGPGGAAPGGWGPASLPNFTANAKLFPGRDR
jgi:hypothetical protein